jgi:thiamine biosynthesis lipoprotein
VELLVDAPCWGAETELDAAEAEIHRLEALLSRFRPDSELSRLNAQGALEASPDLRRVLALALAARERTRGRFDPTVHDALVAAGYDRTFTLVERDSASVTPPPRPASGGIRIDGSIVHLDPGVRIDLGGIAKGYAAERAADLLARTGPCLVNAGGDVATRGGRWPVGIETADGSLTLELGDAGLATSGRDRRRWRRAGVEQHHLIDPRTGTPAKTDLLRVTAVGRDAVEAEVVAKSLFLAGAERAAAEADVAGVAAVLVTADGRSLFTGALAA